MKKILFLSLTLFAANAFAQMPEDDDVPYQKIAKTYRYRVTFTDKKNNSYSLKHPEQFLSEKSLARRKRYALNVDEYDLPISNKYLNKLTQMGLRIHNKSKWNNSVVVETADTNIVARIKVMPMVKTTLKVWESPDSLPIYPQKDRRTIVTNKCDTTLTNFYGFGAQQVEMLGVDKLHAQGFKGKGITIGVIDGGFYNTDLISGFSSTNILGTRNFVRPTKSVYEELEHGMMVLSCIAANKPHYLVGTAPEASFYLLQSEDGDTEQLVEEDNWCAALEYADSVGCDMVTSSLGYYHFDHKEMNHQYYELNGHTAINSKSASLCASRGILLVNSAGNSGDDRWKKIGFPADACDMITIGSVRKDSLNSTFSSLGNTADGRIKPDVMAVGQASAVYDTKGEIAKVNGTSFSCPTMCGAVACLLQAFPTKRPTELINAIQQSGNNAIHPDNIYGYGIPNMVKASEILKTSSCCTNKK